MIDKLGNVVFYSLPSDLLVPLPELERFREELDPMIKLPKKPTLVNLWKRILRTRQKDELGNVYSFGDEQKGDDSIYHYLIKENGEETETMGWLLWDSSDDENNGIKYNPIIVGLELVPVEQTIVEQLKNDMVDHMAVRSVIKDALEDKFKAVWLMSGTYFVETMYTEKLDILKELVRSLGGEFQVIPLINTEEQRDMVGAGYIRMIRAIEKEFRIKLIELPLNPSAFKVKKLEAMIKEIGELEEKVIQYTGALFSASIHLQQELDEKLEAK